MIRHTLAAATLLLAAPATAQSQQEALDARYDRALAAGYKALMLCSAIANAEANGTIRTPESVAHWELAGIQAPFEGIVAELRHEIVRHGKGGEIAYTSVQWSDGAPPRFAQYRKYEGCSVLPVGSGPPAEVVFRKNGGANWHINNIAAHDAKIFDIMIDASDAQNSNMLKSQNSPLDTVLAAAFNGGYGKGSRTTAALVRTPAVQVGQTFEAAQFMTGFNENVPQRTWSVAKSIAATLIGAAVYRGEADVNASAGLGLSDSDPRRAITIDHLLRMASGRYSNTPGNRTDQLDFGGATVEEVALDWPLVAAPGSIFRYANNDTLAAVAAIKGTFAAHPPAAFFAELGMTGTAAETDWQGDYILSSQVWATADDLAQLGQLYLNDGKLPSGERILPEGWVQYVSTPSGPQPDGPFGYGAGFWLMNSSEGVPPDTFAAFGNRGQYVVIVPSRQVVIVRRGEDPVGARFDIAAFTRDVLAALSSD